MRRRRIRGGTVALVVAIATAVGGYVLWRTGDWAVRRLVYENTSFAIHQIEAQTDGVILPEQIRKWAGVRLDQNLFSIDLARVKRDLELVPAIQSAAVERVLPHTLRLRITEREPVAQIIASSYRLEGDSRPTTYLVDAAGFVMIPLEPHQRIAVVPAAEQYPTIVGVNLADVRPGRQIETPAVRAALKLIRQFEQSAMVGVVDIARVDVTAPDIITLETAQQNLVTFRSPWADMFRTEDWERQLNRWRLIHDHGLRDGRQIARVDLSVMDNIPLHWHDTSAAPPPVKPRVKKPSIYRKRHV